MCGDCLLIAPVKQPGGAVDICLPRGDDWIDLNTGIRHAGGTLLEQCVGLATLPHFGRVGYAPLGPALDRVDAMNATSPLDEVWVSDRSRTSDRASRSSITRSRTARWTYTATPAPSVGSELGRLHDAGTHSLRSNA